MTKSLSDSRYFEQKNILLKSNPVAKGKTRRLPMKKNFLFAESDSNRLAQRVIRQIPSKISFLL